MKTPRSRLNNVVGQLNGAGRMMDESEDCEKILIQLKAASKALDKLTIEHLKQNIDSCLSKTSQKDKQKLDSLLNKLISI